MGAVCRECRWVNKRCKLPPWPKKPCESQVGWGKGRGLKGAVPLSTSSEMGGKKGGRSRRGGRGGTSNNKIVSV